MAKILGKDSIKTAIPKMVELSEEFIINGQIYNKNNMSPQPYKTLAIENAVSGLLDPIMYESAYITSKSLSATPRTKNSIVIDNLDTNITYVINNTNSGLACLYRITKINGNYRQERVELISSIGSNYGGYAEIIDQDENYVYVFNNVGVDDTNSYNTRISQVDKATLTVTVSNLSGGRSTVLYKDNIYIYVASISGAGILSIYRYMKSSATFTKIFSQAADNSSQYVIKPLIGGATFENNKISFYYFTDSIDTTLHRLVAKRCEIDTLFLTSFVENVEIDFNGLDENQFLLPAFSNYLRVVLEQIILESNGKKILTLAPYTTGNYKTPIEINNIYSFEIIDKSKFKLISKESLSGFYATMLPLNNNNTLAMANENLITFLKWDDSEFKYKETNSYVNEVCFVSRDMNNTIWIQNKDTSVEQFSLSIPIEIYADFEQESYEFSGDNLSTNIIVYSKNFGGDYIESSITLTLTGNCYFASNGGKNLILNTSSAKPMEISVIITGPSVIGVNAVLV